MIAVHDGRAPLVTPLSGDTPKVPVAGIGVCSVWVGSPDGVCVQLSTDSCQLVRVSTPPITDTLLPGSMAGTAGQAPLAPEPARSCRCGETQPHRRGLPCRAAAIMAG